MLFPGHYIGWVRHKGDEWVKFDDDTVTSVTSEEILRLSGGGDWHLVIDFLSLLVKVIKIRIF